MTTLTVGRAARVERCKGLAGRSKTDTAEAGCDNLVLQSLVETGGGTCLLTRAASNKPFPVWILNAVRDRPGRLARLAWAYLRERRTG